MRRILLINAVLLLMAMGCEEDDENVSPEVNSEEFSMDISGFGNEPVEYKINEEVASNAEVIDLLINPAFNADRMTISLQIPAEMSHSGHEEHLDIVLRNMDGESPWEFTGSYPLLTAQQQQFEEERFAIMSYMIDDEDNTFYDSDRIGQIPASIEITSVDGGSLQGTFGGSLASSSGNRRISISGDFNARLSDDLEE